MTKDQEAILALTRKLEAAERLLKGFESEVGREFAQHGEFIGPTRMAMIREIRAVLSEDAQPGTEGGGAGKCLATKSECGSEQWLGESFCMCAACNEWREKTRFAGREPRREGT
jgi:hypothetical protein